MKITSVRATAFTLPQRKQTSSSGMSKSVGAIPGVLIEVESDTGHTGVTEVSGHPVVYGETQRSIIEIVDYLAPNLEGLDPLDTERMTVALNAPRGVAYALSAKAGLDMAIHDLIGRGLGVPVYKYLGGWSDPPAVELSWMLSLGAPDAIVAEAEEMAAHGFTAFKIKVGRDPERDVATVAALRQALGGDVLLCADANESYAPAVAVRTVRRMEDYDLAWIEDPCPSAVPAETRRRIADSLSIPVMGDMACHSAQAALRELQAGTVGIIALKMFRTGFTESKRIVLTAEQFGVPCLIGTSGESTIGMMAACHLGASLRNIRQPAEVAYPTLLEDEIVTADTPRLEGANVVLDPTRPGIGVDIDRDKLSVYADRELQEAGV